MFPETAGPVIDELELLLSFPQGTVAVVDSGGISQTQVVTANARRQSMIRCLLTRNLYVRQAGGEGIVGFGRKNSRDTNRWTFSEILGVVVEPITNVPESEVGKQFRAQRICESRRNALITGSGNSRKPQRIRASAAGVFAKCRRAGVAEFAEAVAAKQPDCRPQVVIGPQIKAVCVEDLFS